MENIFWDKKINIEEAKKILKDEKHPKFIYLASTVLLRTNDAKKVFSDYIEKIVFCRNWNKIKRRMRKNKWNDRNIDFWDEIYNVTKEGIEPERLKGSQGEKAPVTPQIKKLGDILREARKEAKLTQKVLAKKTKLSQQTISSLEKGYLNFSFETLTKILEVLNLQIFVEPKDGYSAGTNEHGENVVKYRGAGTHEWQMFSQPLTEKMKKK